MSISEALGTSVKGLIQSFLFSRTVGAFHDALGADSLASSVEMLLHEASTRPKEFGLGVLVLISFTLIVSMLVTLVVRVILWICVKVLKSEKAFQRQTAAERREHQLRVEEGGEVPCRSGAEGMREIGAVMTDVRSHIHRNVEQSTATTAEKVCLPARRSGPRAVAASTLRGYTEVDLLVSSPSQGFLLVGCRSKKKTAIYPMTADATLLHKAKELQEKAVSIETAIAAVAGEERRLEVYSAQFAMDDTRLVAGERISDTFYVFSVSAGTGLLLPLWHFKLPNHRLVSSLTSWSVLDGDKLLNFSSERCEVEVITRDGTSLKDKFKVGTASSWAQLGSKVAVAGSFLKEARLSTVVVRDDRITLNSLGIFPNPAKLRVTAMALVLKGVPSFNTHNYLVVFTEDGVGTIYDLESLAHQNVPEVVCTFTDTDYAGYDTAHPLRIFAAVCGKAYQERLLLAMVRGSDLTVLRQEGQSGKVSQMGLLMDLVGPQEGGVIKEAVFVQRGKGIATCGDGDGHQVRLFHLPEWGST